MQSITALEVIEGQCTVPPSGFTKLTMTMFNWMGQLSDADKLVDISR